MKQIPKNWRTVTAVLNKAGDRSNSQLDVDPRASTEFNREIVTHLALKSIAPCEIPLTTGQVFLQRTLNPQGEITMAMGFPLHAITASLWFLYIYVFFIKPKFCKVIIFWHPSTKYHANSWLSSI